MEEAFEGLEGVPIIIDDILVYGANPEEHDERLQAVMERALEKGVKFNKDKCSFSASSVCCFGHVIGADGMKPDPEKLKAIKEVPRPQSCLPSLECSTTSQNTFPTCLLEIKAFKTYSNVSHSLGVQKMTRCW
ncbi:hypothetical protein QYM36_017137 [Artemia franciscana]|uniref:Reverse transcriptase domain-containing protein n=1 Tax=Artemia franciscana TaxID=6661 RepID=A0AA88L259_ARTSF|nr:hypothetical protein QYM36_017137 [Artemia franciscana]